MTALSSFVEKADLLAFVIGGTMPALTLTNVHFLVDGYIEARTIQLHGLRLSVT